MALDRFSNIEEIQETNGSVRGVVWNQDDLDILQLDLKRIQPEQIPVVELHLYTIGSESNYIAGGCIDDFEIKNGQIYINYGKACQSLGIERGQFEVVINIYKDLLGSKEEQGLWIKEISDDRREVWIQAFPDADLDVTSYIESFGSGQYAEKIYEKNADDEIIYDQDGNPILSGVIERPLSDDIALNLGKNQILKIINQKEWQSENDFVVRLYKPLPDDIFEKQKLWTIEQLSDAYIDNISLAGPGAKGSESRELLGPNFDIDVSKGTITETDFETWNSLLSSNTSTSQLIVDRIFSGSLGQSVNIDYSGFQNFIHFSSAAERLANFKYKLELIEYYDGRIETLRNATGEDANALQGNITTNQERQNDVIGNFDGFERWLYNDSTSSLFTDHSTYSNNNNKDGIYAAEGGFLGSDHYRLESFPKYLSGSKQYLHPSTSSIATEWYTGWHSSASFYDSENNKSLTKSIPEHIRLDSNNSEYELFVNMIGHHYDILYSHIENLTKIYKPEEHPKLGQSKDTLYQIAESLGWKLENGNQASQLWQYKLGINSGSGEYTSTGSLFSKPDEEITTEVWRRIVNNLPYLLKTKGTARSVKALMNTYGIPQTLLSIREYGGPKVLEDAPTLIEDRFSYALQFNQIGDAAELDSNVAPRIQHGVRDYTTDIGTWGFVRPFLSSGDDIPPQTREFRFKPAVKQNMLLYSQTNEYSSADNRVNSQIAIQYTGSYSGSDQYGRIVYSHGKGEGNTQPSTGSTEWVPLFDGNFWNLRWFWQATGSDSGIYNIDSNLNTTYHIQVQQASDYIDDKIVHRSSASYMPTSNAHRYGWNAMPSDSDNRQSYLGGAPGVGSTRDQFRVNTNLRRFVEDNNGISFSNDIAPNMTMFSGSMQEYREWLEDIGQTTFDLHTTNPTSYVSGLDPTSSYDTLVRHYPLGTDLNAVDHSLSSYQIMSSSHPAQTIIDAQLPYDNFIISGSTFATMSNFPVPVNVQRGNYTPVEETYYVQGVSLGGNVPRSQKIRLEDNELVRRLSPKTSAEKSRFDRAPIDTNKLGLFYSAADQINKEIFNHIGDVALDDYVGDPDHEFTSEYPDLTHFSKEYWKKYSDKNDINAYLRVFSQFDYSLFNQIKQLLPERVDESMGLLVEPHALERAKVRLTKKPEVTNPQYDGRIEDPVKDVSGDTLLLTGSIDSPINVTDTVQVYNVGSSGYSDSGNYLANLHILTSGDPYKATIYKHIYKFFPYQRDPVAATALNLPMEITGTLSPLTFSPTGSIILTPRPSSIFSLDKLHYSGSIELDKRTRNLFTEVSRSLGMGVPSKYNYSRSLDEVGYMDDFIQMTENQKYDGCRLVGPGINLPTTINALGQKPVVEVFETNPNTLIFNNQPNSTNPGNLEVR
jgi:hypothetical protein|tara:strand:+ start:4019 stop:8176 length:4158 start_codon:yes stop_codon:yes gene_type:complete